MGLASYFVRDTREDGTTFVALADGAPEWVQDAIRSAHFGRLPDDWIYEECQAAFQAFDDGMSSEEPDIDSRVDVYTSALFDWAAKHFGDDLFCEAEEDCPGGPLANQIMMIQSHYIDGIFRVILEACEEHENGEEL